MFRAKTVLVLGAGASAEVDLPMGPELLSQIVELTHITFDHYQQNRGDRLIADALRTALNEGREVEQFNAHIKAAWQLSKSAKQALSIDNVIDALEDTKIELVGKLGIARAILKAEENSPYFYKHKTTQSIDVGRFQNSWYSYLTKVLTEGVKRSEIDNIFSNLEIINFNYDRCIEYYLPVSLGEYYGVAPSRIQEVMAQLTIHRPYGRVGQLPWQNEHGPRIEFGGCTAEDLANVAQQIRTFTEQFREGTALESMRNSISSADRIIFLGFAFHRQNVEIISSAVQQHTEVIATAYGISRSDKDVIASELEAAFRFEGIMNDSRIELADLKCVDLFREYWRTITSAPGSHRTIQMPGDNFTL